HAQCTDQARETILLRDDLTLRRCELLTRRSDPLARGIELLFRLALLGGSVACALLQQLLQILLRMNLLSQLIVYARDQCRPEIRVGVVPCIERDLPDTRAPLGHGTRVALDRIVMSGNTGHVFLELRDEERLAGPPVAEQAERQRRLHALRCNEMCNRPDLVLDVEQVRRTLLDVI